MADNVIFSNNASALLAASITAVDTTIQVASGFGALFPSPGGTEFFYATLEDDAGNIEIVKCTSRTGDNLTVVRAQDGTTAQAFTLTVTRVELRATKIVLEEFLQKNGGAMTGAIDMNGNNITDAILNGTSTQIVGGQIVGVPMRGDAGVSSNELVVPSGGGRATVGGAEILAAGDDVVAQLDVAGVITLDSATTGVVMDQSGAYFRMEGAFRVAAGGVATDYGEQSHNGTDYLWTFAQTDDLVISGITNGIVLSDLELGGAEFYDFSTKKQTVAAATSLAIDYTAGNYVEITMGTNITSLTINNPPASGVGSLRLKFVQDAVGSRTCTGWTGFHFPNGVAPTLSTTALAVDFVDLWYDGTTWYGGFEYDWQAVS